MARRSRKKRTSIPPPRLSLCMIVRDNQRTIEPCLASIRPWVDEMIVIDTGSKDTTPRIAKRLGAKVSSFPWCDDFSAARNVSLERARGQWLFWMDSDDTIPPECGRRLRQLADGQHRDSVLGYVMQVHCPGPTESQGHEVTVVDHVKLFRNLPQLRFQGRIHEQIIPAIRRLGGEVAWTDIHVVHSGSDHSSAAKQKKYERDLRLLQLELQDQPDHPFHLFNVGMTYNDMEQHEEAVLWLRRALAVAKVVESHTRKIYALLAGSLAALKRLDEALQVCNQGLIHYPHDAEVHFRRGIILYELGRLTEAIAAYREALQDREGPHFSSLDPGIKGHKAKHNLAVIYTQLGQHSMAELQWRQIVDVLPERHRTWFELGESLIRQQKFATLEQQLAAMGRRDGLKLETLLLEGAWAMALRQKDTVRERLVELQRNFSGDERVQHLACRFYFEQGTLAEAQEALERLVDQHGDEPAALHNLGVVYRRQGNLHKAADALRRSLVLRCDAPHTQLELAQVQQEMHQQTEIPR